MKDKPLVVYIFCLLLVITTVAAMLRGPVATVVQATGGEEEASYGLISPESLFAAEFGAAMSVDVTVDVPVTAEAYISDWSEDELSDEIKVEIEKTGEPVRVPLSAGEPQILIYHTHTTEAYRQAYEGEYVESDPWRSNDNEKNIVAVGEALKRELESYGFNVLHDITNHEPPKLATAYSRSVQTMERYREEYPSLRVFIDLHRDAGNVDTQQDDVVVVDGKRCAKVMFVVGQGTSESTKDLEKPYFEENYALAQSVCNRLAKVDTDFCRDIRVKTGRYNQHISDACLLLEVGHNAITLEEALNSIPYVAQALSDCLTIEDV